MKTYKYQFSVFTPCYNSASTIHRVIESLKGQSFKDFEWIIVDDGSTDDLYENLSQVINGNEFPVKYLRQNQNCGKPSAINLGVANAEGEFFLIIDADDSFTFDALEVLNNSYQALPEHIKPEISGVTVHCQDQYGNFIGTPYSTPPPPPHATNNGNEYLLCSVFDMRYKFKVEGEKWGFTKTDIMKEFSFNTSIDKFVTENTVWFAIADKYKALFINKILRTYYINENNNSLNNIGAERYPAGFVFYYQEIINKYTYKMYLSFVDIVRLYKNMIKYSLYAGIKPSMSIKKLNTKRKQLFAYCCIPLGYLAIYIDKQKQKK